MHCSRFLSLSAFAGLLSLAIAQDDPDSTCSVYGVDFLDDQSYFINSASTDEFTVVQYFEGCNDDTADVLFVLPDGDELICSDVPTVPADTNEVSTCPIQKDQLTTGDYIVLVIGNNADGNPFAWERDIYLDVGTQATTTSTPTVTFTVTTTPTVTSTITQSFTSTFGPSTTVTLALPTTTTVSEIFTQTFVDWSKELVLKTATVTASCTVPRPHVPPKWATYSPTKIHPAALASPSPTSKARKLGRAVDVGYARARFAAAKARRDQKAAERAERAALGERAPDAPTLTITADPVNATATYTVTPAATISNVVNTTISTTLPPTTVTIFPTTKTRFSFGFTTVHTTKTVDITFTKTITTTPSALITQCKNEGGHFAGRR